MKSHGRWRVTTALPAALLIVAMLGVVEVAAHTGNCSTDRFCAWWNADYSGDRQLNNGQDYYATVTPGNSNMVEDTISSMANHAPTTKWCGWDTDGINELLVAADATGGGGTTHFNGTAGPAWANDIDKFELVPYTVSC